MKKDKWTQQLHDKLADYKTPAPEGLWDDIEAALEQQTVSPVVKKAPTRFVSLRRWAAAAAVAAMLVGGSLILYNNNVEQSEEFESVYSENMLTEKQQEPMTIQTEEPLTEKEPIQQKPMKTERKEPLIAEAQKETLLKAEEATGKEELPEKAPVDVRPEEVKENSSTPSVSAMEKKSTLDSNLSSPSEYTTPKASEKRISLNLYAMNSLGTKNNSNSVFMADALARNYTSTFDEANMPAASRQSLGNGFLSDDEDLQYPIFLSGYEERQHHRQPVAFGLTVDYPLTNRLSLTSGVVYTKLRSDFTQIIHSQQISQEQTLHYVGIPLSLNYCLWQGGRSSTSDKRQGPFKAYVAAGMQADWNVAARQSTEGVESHIDRDRMQWSASASLGLQYTLPLGKSRTSLSGFTPPRLALYAEPGINHYFNNGSPVQNFFKDKPTSFKLQLGLRLQLP